MCKIKCYSYHIVCQYNSLYLYILFIGTLQKLDDFKCYYIRNNIKKQLLHNETIHKQDYLLY